MDIIGYHIDSLLDETTVDEKSVEKLFEMLDEKGIFVDYPQPSLLDSE